MNHLSDRMRELSKEYVQEAVLLERDGYRTAACDARRDAEHLRRKANQLKAEEVRT